MIISIISINQCNGQQKETKCLRDDILKNYSIVDTTYVNTATYKYDVGYHVFNNSKQLPVEICIDEVNTNYYSVYVSINSNTILNDYLYLSEVVCIEEENFRILYMYNEETKNLIIINDYQIYIAVNFDDQKQLNINTYTISFLNQQIKIFKSND